MIPLSRVCLRPNRGLYRRSVKKTDFWAKNTVFFGPEAILLGHIPIFCYGTPYGQGFCFEMVARWAPGRPLVSKNTIFSPKKGHFGQSGPENGPPSSPTGTYKKTEGIQSYLRTWGRYDPIELGLTEAKRMSYVGVA